jgi:uncharacterized repeat protein (TIGR01451 family)
MGKSLYVIASIDASPTPIEAYDIQPAPNYLAYQSVHGVPRRAGGGVGLCIDSDTATLFITYEDSGIVQLVNGTTMNSTGYTVAPGAANLAGIVYDRLEKKVYTVDRMTNHLYAYSWDPSTLNLTLDEQVDLQGVSSAHGVALDEHAGRLYVGDMVDEDNIKVFSTDGWSPVANYTVNQSVQAVALDARRRILYAGHSWGGYGSRGLLIRLDMESLEEISVSIPELTGIGDDTAVGIAVDSDTGLVYVTTGNQGGGGSDLIMVFDSNLNLLHNVTIIGGPTGIAVPTGEVSYNPLQLVKTPSRERAARGQRITYKITFDNSANDYELTNVTIEDTLPPGLEFVSASEGSSYDPETRRVTWIVERVEAGATGGTVTVVARVSSNATKGETIANAVTIASDQTPPTTQATYTNVSGFGGFGLGESPLVRDSALVGGALVVSYAVGWGLAAAATKLWLIPKGAELSTQLLVGRATKYGVMVLGGLFALAQTQTEIDSAPVVVGAGVVGLAFAFGSKEIVANLVSGVIVAIDRPLKRGDIVEVEGAVGEVLDVGLRATSIRTLDNVTHLIPNTVVVLNKVTNYTKYDPQIRLQIQVGVAYGSDMGKVKELLLSVANEHPKVLDEPAAEARIVEFGNSAVRLILFAWIDDPAERFRIKDELNWQISNAFREKGIKIPLPQTDLWMRE